MQSDQGSKTSKLIQLQEYDHLRRERKPPMHIREAWIGGSLRGPVNTRRIPAPQYGLYATVFHNTYEDSKGRQYWTKVLRRTEGGPMEDLYDERNEGAWP